MMQLFVWTTIFFPPKKCLIFPDKVHTGRGGVGVIVRVRIVLKVVFWAVFEISRLINTGTTRGPHHIPRFLYFILDNNSDVR